MSFLVSAAAAAAGGGILGAAAGGLTAGALGAGLGATSAAIQGQDIGKGALMGAVSGVATAGVGAGLGAAAGPAAGLATDVAVGAGAGAAGGAAGAAAGGQDIGKGALVGGATGAVTSGISSGMNTPTGVTQDPLNSLVPPKVPTNLPNSPVNPSLPNSPIPPAATNYVADITGTQAITGLKALGAGAVTNYAGNSMINSQNAADTAAQQDAARGVANANQNNTGLAALQNAGLPTQTSPLNSLTNIGKASGGITALAHGGQVPLKDGAYIIPADVVSALGNGSSKAGAEYLKRLMIEVRKEAANLQGLGAAKRHGA